MITQTTPKSSRFVAIETLHRLRRTKLPISQIFDQIVHECSLSHADRQLAMKICYGVIRQGDYLNHLLTLLCKQPVNKIKPFVYHALSVGLYQLFFLDRIPPSAAVNETVHAVRAAHLPKQLQGFVNGVLRETIRKKNKLPQPHNPVEGNSPFLNHPTWLTKRWEHNYGLNTMQLICSANNREAVTCLRVTHRTTVKEYLELLADKSISAQAGQYAPDSIQLPEFQGAITNLPGFHEGLFQVQDQSAQLATMLLGPFNEEESYLDCCAGVGGKTTHIASLADHKNCSITALEPTPSRFRQLQENLSRTTDNGQISVHNETLERFSRSSKCKFNKILVDAPCSGTGVIGRQPDIRRNRENSDITSFQQRQLNLLKESATLLQPGGVLVYATCSIEPEENIDVINRFLETTPGFSLSNGRELLPSAAHMLIKDNCFAPLPNQGTDGFFGARLVSLA